jgi:hypothetical protein
LKLQEKADRLNELKILNEELERDIKEKDEFNSNLQNVIKDLEKNLESYEKAQNDFDQVNNLYKIVIFRYFTNLNLKLRKQYNLKKKFKHYYFVTSLKLI